MPLRRDEGPSQSSHFTPCLDPPPSLPDAQQFNNNATTAGAGESQSSNTDSLVQGETIHLKPVHGECECEILHLQ